jgi:hypothetical protein
LTNHGTFGKDPGFENGFRLIGKQLKDFRRIFRSVFLRPEFDFIAKRGGMFTVIFLRGYVDIVSVICRVR